MRPTRQYSMNFMGGLILLSTIAMPLISEAQLEVYGRFKLAGRLEPNINYAASKRISEKVSLTLFGLVEKEWSEALIGASFSPTPSFKVGAGIGMEHGSSSPRYAASLWKAKGRFSLLLLGELGTGKSNYLYKANLFHQYSEKFTIGITAWRFHGIGPNFRLTSSKHSLTIWCMPAYDVEYGEPRLMTGASLSMK